MEHTHLSALPQGNLLLSLDFLMALKFEAAYAGRLRGGHLPRYLVKRRLRSLVNKINFLTPAELQQLANTNFNSAN